MHFHSFHTLLLCNLNQKFSLKLYSALYTFAYIFQIEERQSRSSTPLEVLFHKLMGNIHMNLEMCKHIFFVDFFIMSFLIIYNDLQSKKAKGKPTGFWALGSRLCLNFPLFCWCYIQNISHVEIFFFSTLLPLYISKEIM